MTGPLGDSEVPALLTELRFGTDGIRGAVGPVINPETIARIVAGIAQHCATDEYRLAASLPERPVALVVGGDCRSTSDYFVKMASQILTALGVRVLQCQGYVTTPMLALAVLTEKAHGGVMVTASHNPPEHNGIKFIPWYGGSSDPDTTAAIEVYLNSDPPDLEGIALGTTEQCNPAPAYATTIGQLIDFQRIKQAKLKICFDALYGAGKAYFRQIMLSHDIPARILHGDDDPWMGRAIPDPTAERLRELASVILADGYDLGIAADGDADRFAAVDAHGVYVAPNQCLAILAHYLYAYQGATGNLARTVSTTHRLDRIAQHHGFATRVTSVGFKYMTALLRSDPTILMAGEESGGFTLRGHVPSKDGLLACFLLLEACAVSGKGLAALATEVEATYGPWAGTRLDWALTEAEGRGLEARLNTTPSLELGGETFARSTGDRLEFATADGSWVLLRQSGTEDLWRIYIETDSSERLRRIVETVEGWRG